MEEGQTSKEAANRQLITDVYGDPAFVSSDVNHADFSGTKLKEAVEQWNPTPFLAADGWKTSNVTISVPLGLPKGEKSYPLSIDYTVPGVHHRSITDVIKRVLTTDPNVADFHLYPYREYVTQPKIGEKPLRVFDDVFSSDALLDEPTKLQAQPRELGCNLERVVIGLQFWSDATQLANFGSAKLWPVYMAIGNQPKWARSRLEAARICIPATILPISLQYVPSSLNYSLSCLQKSS